MLGLGELIFGLPGDLGGFISLTNLAVFFTLIAFDSCFWIAIFFIRGSFEGDMMLPLITGGAFLLASELLTFTTFLLFRKLQVSVFDLEEDVS